MKRAILAILLTWTVASAQVPIWPGKIPDPSPVSGPEVKTTEKGVEFVTNVSHPTLTVFKPKGTNTGAAVVVFPGGGYQCLATDLEGTEVCDWLNSIGMTGILLKYRVPSAGAYPRSAMPLEDAQRTVSLVRAHAAEWHIDPHKIGVLGFSAGGHLSVAVSTHTQRVYRSIDTVDRTSCRPDFSVVLYPGHLDYDGALNPDIRPTSQTPPTFIVQAEDDPVDNVSNSLLYYTALKRAGVPAEIHLYAHGGHAFGLRRTQQPITHWPDLVETWLHTIGILTRS